MIICAIGLIVALVWFTFDIKIYKEQGNYFLFYTNIKGWFITIRAILFLDLRPSEAICVKFLLTDPPSIFVSPSERS